MKKKEKGLSKIIAEVLQEIIEKLKK